MNKKINGYIVKKKKTRYLNDLYPRFILKLKETFLLHCFSFPTQKIGCYIHELLQDMHSYLTFKSFLFISELKYFSKLMFTICVYMGRGGDVLLFCFYFVCLMWGLLLFFLFCFFLFFLFVRCFFHFVLVLFVVFYTLNEE